MLQENVITKCFNKIKRVKIFVLNNVLFYYFLVGVYYTKIKIYINKSYHAYMCVIVYSKKKMSIMIIIIL